MLKRLTIKNIALVKSADVKLNGELTVLTGETGAGKSIMVNALSLVLGERADNDLIRHGQNNGSVTACFDLSAMPAGYRRQHDSFIQDGNLTVERELLRSGGSKVKINGKSATLSQLREITKPLAQILGQHAGQMLLSEANHLFFLDSFAGVVNIRNDVSEIFHHWQKSALELKRVHNRRQQLIDERELLLFQKAEIAKAEITPGEEEKLLAERKILDSARSLMTGASLVTDILGADEHSVLSMLPVAVKELEKMSAVDDSLTERLKALESLRLEIDDLRSVMEQYGASLQDDPARVEQINLRLDEIYILKKKYGGSEESVLATLADINSRLNNRPDVDHVIAELTKATASLFKDYSTVALKLSKKRKQSAAKLRKLIIAELAELAIEEADFEFEFIYEDDPGGVIIGDRAVKIDEHGLESVRIMFSANRGQPLKPLVKTASGGEVSRLFLALKSAEKSAGRMSNALLVFDEVDVGIGGTTGNALGEKLKSLSMSSQIIVVTHLHQIARVAGRHLIARKTTTDNEALIQIEQLKKGEIKSELDRMVALPEEA